MIMKYQQKYDQNLNNNNNKKNNIKKIKIQIIIIIVILIKIIIIKYAQQKKYILEFVKKKNMEKYNIIKYIYKVKQIYFLIMN